MSGEKHLVTVGSHEVDEYIARGFERSHMSARDAIGSELFELVDKKTQDSLVVMQIDKAKHEAQNKLPQRFMLEMPQAAFAARADVPAFELMEAGELQSIVARASADTCPVEVESASLFETRREAVVAGRDRILTEIEAHRAVADGLEKFLKRYEVL